MLPVVLSCKFCVNCEFYANKEKNRFQVGSNNEVKMASSSLRNTLYALSNKTEINPFIKHSIWPFRTTSDKLLEN